MKYLYKQLFENLKDNGVHSLETLPLAQARNYSHPTYSSHEHPWLNETAQLIRNTLKLGIEIISRERFPLFFGCHPINIKHGSGAKLGPPHNLNYYENRAKYSCLLPGKTIHVAGSLINNESGSPRAEGEIDIYEEYFQQLFLLKPLLLNDMSILIPRRYVDYYGDYGSTKESILNIKNEGKINIFTEKDSEFENLNKAGDHSLLKLLEQTPLLSPLAKNIDVEHFVDLAGSHEKEFEMHRNSFMRILRFEKDTPLKKWIYEYDTSIDQLNYLYTKENEKVQKTGKTILLGTAITLLSLLVPNIPADIKTALAALISGKNVSDSIQWLRQKRSIDESLSNNLGWFLWKASS